MLPYRNGPSARLGCLVMAGAFAVFLAAVAVALFVAASALRAGFGL